MNPLLNTLGVGWLVASCATTVHAQTACFPLDRAGDSMMSSSAPLTLARAMERAALAAPELQAVALERQARSADTGQASRWLNPTMSIEAENFDGRGALSGFDGAETTLAFGQTFRLGGKRELAVQAAVARERLGDAECRLALRDVRLTTGTLYYALEAAIERAELAQTAAQTALALATVVEKRVEAGAAAAPELARARADAAAQSSLSDTAQGDVEATALALASIWGASQVDFVLPVPAERAPHPEKPTHSESIHPQTQAAQAQAMVLDADTAVARSRAIPDLTVTTGIRRFEETDDEAFVVAISLPIPLFDRNVDATMAAGLRQNATVLMANAVESRLQAQIRATRAQLGSAQTALARLRDEALPSAQQAYGAAQQGYRVGKFDLTTTLDARRSLIDTQAARIEAKRSTNTLALRLQSLTGTGPFSGDQHDG